MNEAGLSAMAKVFAVAVVFVLVQFALLVMVVVTMFVVLDQGRTNEQHIDCIVASAQVPPPEVCAGIIQQLVDEGILDLPPTTS